LSIKILFQFKIEDYSILSIRIAGNKKKINFYKYRYKISKIKIYLKNVLVFIAYLKNYIVVSKKGKFRILSYLIDKSLIYYKSINKEKTILAFALFKLSGYYPADIILQDFLKRGLIIFYSIEINIIKPDEILYLLCIKSDNKGEIFKIFNSISYKLNQVDQSIHFFKDESLEKEFLKILSIDNDKNSLVSEALGSIQVKNDSTQKRLDFYVLNYDEIPEGDNLLYQFINYVGNLKRFGYLIFNFQLINDYISAEIYFIEFIEDLKSQISNLEFVVNEFFGIDLLCKLKLEIKGIFSPLFRYRLMKNNYASQDISKIQNLEYFYNYKYLLSFTDEFRELLEANSLEFHQFSQNLFFVEQTTLVIILATRQFKFLLNLIKKYRSKFYLLVIVLNSKGYYELMKMEKINTIPNLKIINYEEFCQFDLKTIKNI